MTEIEKPNSGDMEKGISLHGRKTGNGDYAQIEAFTNPLHTSPDGMFA